MDNLSECDSAIKAYKDKLSGIYSEFIKDVRNEPIHRNREEDISCFIPQWGTKYRPGEGVLFVGRATNGWGCSLDPKDWDRSSHEDPADETWAFNDKYQLTWVGDPEKMEESLHTGKPRSYSASRSAFWRVIRAVTIQYYDGSEGFNEREWYQYIAWSNVCKWSRGKCGNPTRGVYNRSLEYNRDAFEVDIGFFQPRAIVMITGLNAGFETYTKPFLAKIIDPEEAARRSNNENVKVYHSKNSEMKVVVTDRPERRPEGPIIDAVLHAL